MGCGEPIPPTPRAQPRQARIRRFPCDAPRHADRGAFRLLRADCDRQLGRRGGSEGQPGHVDALDWRLAVRRVVANGVLVLRVLDHREGELVHRVSP